MTQWYVGGTIVRSGQHLSDAARLIILRSTEANVQRLGGLLCYHFEAGSRGGVRDSIWVNMVMDLLVVLRSDGARFITTGSGCTVTKEVVFWVSRARSQDVARKTILIWNTEGGCDWISSTAQDQTWSRNQVLGSTILTVEPCSAND